MGLRFMKTRHGFVSNSSSSSFIIIEDDGDLSDVFDYDGREFVIDKNLGEYEFGWQEEKYYDFGSKVIWCWIQAKEDADKIDMLFNIIRLYTKADNIRVELDTDYKNEELTLAYIDHESMDIKGNSRMFDSETMLAAFLFNPNSYIQNDNDNH